MNEPPNSPESRPPPPRSDSTPPPPPPPPFTPPPAPPSVPPAQPPPAVYSETPPSAVPPRAPIYTPPPGQPPKKSSLPWILGGCGCLTLLLLIAIGIGIAMYRAKQKVADFRSDIKKPGDSTYVNVKENLPTGLQPNFVAFSFNYPKSFNLQPQSDVNFVKIEKYAA